MKVLARITAAVAVGAASVVLAQNSMTGPAASSTARDAKPTGTLSGTGPSPYGSGGSPNSAPDAGYTASSKVPYTKYGRDNPNNSNMPPKGESAGPPTATMKKRKHHKKAAASSSSAAMATPAQ